MKNLSFKEWFKLKEVMVGQTPEDKAAQDQMDIAIIKAGAGTGTLVPPSPQTTALKAVEILQKDKKFTDIKNKQLVRNATAAATAAAAKKPATTGANPAAKTI